MILFSAGGGIRFRRRRGARRLLGRAGGLDGINVGP